MGISKMLGFQVSQIQHWLNKPSANVKHISGNSLSTNIGNFERTDAFSVECWFYQTTMKSGSLVSHGTSSPLLRGWILQTWTGRNVGLSLCSDNGTANYLNARTASSIFPFNTWTHVIFTYNGNGLASGVKGYINGTARTLSVPANTLSGTIANSDPLWIGRSHPYGYFPGRIDEVVIYDRVLSASEVVQRYNSGVGTETAFGSTYLHYHLNESVGNIAIDSSDNLVHGTLQNNPIRNTGKLGNCIYLNGSSQYIEIL